LFVLAQTSGSNAIPALIVIVAGFVLGSLAAALARRITGGENRPEAIRSSAGAIATLFFSIILIAALVIALGMINETALDQLSQDVVSFLPKALSAAIVLIVGNIVGAIAETGIRRSLGHVSPAIRDRVPTLVKVLISGFALIIAANQLGVDTTIILVAVASIFLAVALSVALLAGLGGRPVAEQVAAGRALRRELSVGDSVRVGSTEGEISAIGSTSTQITGGRIVTLIPNAELLTSHLEIVEAVPTIELAED
jgi:small-conductance mechanosensitive channel